MAVPYMIGPGGQPIIVGQIPVLPPTIPSFTPAQSQPQPKVADHMNEDKLQEKGLFFKFECKQIYI